MIFDLITKYNLEIPDIAEEIVKSKKCELKLLKSDIIEQFINDMANLDYKHNLLTDNKKH